MSLSAWGILKQRCTVLRLRATLLPLAIVVVLFAGCRKSEPGMQVSGKVTYKGQPVSPGALSFYPSGGRPVTATLSPSGEYACRLPGGEYRATVVVGTNLPPGWKEGDPVPPPAVRIPIKYSQSANTPLKATVGSGQTDPINFVLE